MKISKDDLDQAASQNIISPEQADRLFHFFAAKPAYGPQFDVTHVLYYLGGFIAIGAMTLFMNLGWERFGGWGMFFIALVYAAIGLALATNFKRKGYGTPAGICATFVVALTPMAIYGFQHAMGWWPDNSNYQDYYRYAEWHWIYMELGTLAVGAMIAYAYRYPFLQLPIALTLWFLAVDATALIAGGRADYELQSLVSIYFGLAMILFAFWVDRRSLKSGDYAFWLYLFGVMAFWFGLTAQESDSELTKFLYFCINLALIGVGVIVLRRVFVVFGALGCALYLGHLANEVFEDSWLFLVALTAIGLGTIYLGVLWQKHEAEIARRVRQFLQTKLQ